MLFRSSRHGVFVTPTYLVNELYASHPGQQRLSVRVESPKFDSSREGKGVPYLDAVVSRSSDGKQIFIKAVNTNLTQSLRTEIEIDSVKPQNLAQVETLNAASVTAANSFSTPEAVKIQTRRVPASGNFAIDLPEHSVSVITLNID